MKHFKDKVLTIVVLLIVSMSLFACTSTETSTSDTYLKYNSVEELENKKIGILTGTIYDGF